MVCYNIVIMASDVGFSFFPLIGGWSIIFAFYVKYEELAY